MVRCTLTMGGCNVQNSTGFVWIGAELYRQLDEYVAPSQVEKFYIF